MNPLFIRIFVLVLIFAAVFLTVETVLRVVRARSGSSRAINRRLKMIEGGLDRAEIVSRLRKQGTSAVSQLPWPIGALAGHIERTVQASGLQMQGRQVFLLMMAATAIVFATIVLGAGFAGFGLTFGTVQLALALALSIGIALPMMLLSRLAQNRRKKMQEQFPVALDIFIRGLRSGHPIASAIDLLTNEMEDPIGSEFGLVSDEVSYGADLRDALQEMADRWDLDDMQMFVVSLSVQNETGGNLAEILENLAKVIRERASMFMKVRALSSEGRMTALILTGLPILTFVSMFMVNPAFYLDLTDDPAFIIGSGVLIGLYFLGFFAIKRMVDLKV